jgi:putative ABC transport system substrate-binding protein
MKNNRRELLIVIGGGTLLAPIAAFAQKPAAMQRIGYLTPLTVERDRNFERFTERLRELGYVEGKTLIIDYRSVQGTLHGLPALAAELVQNNVNVIFTNSTPATLAAMRVTRTIPIVFAGVSDPVGQKIVASLARPGGNATGLSNQIPETSAKTLELLKEIVTSATRIAILANPTNEATALILLEMQAAARHLRLETSIVYAQSADELDKAFAEAKRLRADGMAIIADSVFNLNSRKVAALAATYRLPSISSLPRFPEEGGLISYGWNRPAHYRRGAELVDKILKGAKPAELPVEQPTKFDLIVNLKTAKALGLTVPSTIMVRADQLIQ